jgi:hypothetical protein
LVQAVVDHRGIFTDFELGWPGSVVDTIAFKESELWRIRESTLRMMNIYWLIRVFSIFSRIFFMFLTFQTGYPLTKFTIWPFAEYDLTNDHAEKTKRCHFN